ncbi:MAG TPA: hypothetical protein VEQ40_08495, partial [Pyrinomonadaceae bacterium]|nr:hypothetical protein [Pyrinomonadaceae bacterium]
MRRVTIMLAVLLMVAPCLTQAMATVRPGQEPDKKITGAGEQAASTGEQTKQVSLKLEGGERITLRNRFGPIVVTGTGGDSLEATVTEIKKGKTVYKYRLSTTRQGKDRIMITTAVTTTDQAEGKKESKTIGTAQGTTSASPAKKQQLPQTTSPAQPGQTRPPAAVAPRTPPTRPVPPPSRPEMKDTPDSLRGVGELRLEVKLPRNAHIDLIDSRRYAIITGGTPSYLTNTRNDVSVTNIDTPVSIVSSGDVQATRIGGLEAKTRASN